MAKGSTNSSVDWYFAKYDKRETALRMLRAIALDCGLTEELKWGCPCYTLNDKNIVLIHVFKDYFALLFFKGALLKDEKSILIQQTKTVQAARQIRFTNDAEVTQQKRTIKAYILDAIEVEKSGLKVELKKTAEFEMPEELKLKLTEMPALKKAFLALTPGRQRAYLLHFSAAKQSKTREARVVRCTERILQGKGLDDL
jgi:uncharacterized protein YdeI (YjbR/CyaY-like superfamily)